MTFYYPNFGKIIASRSLPNYYQVPLESQTPLDADLYQTKHEICIFVNNKMVHNVTVDTVLNDIEICSHEAIINIHPDPNDSTILGLMFIQLGHDDVDALDALYDAVEIKVNIL